MTTLDDYVEAFESARRGGERIDLASYLPPPDDALYRTVLRELVRIDLEFGWESNRPRELEDYRQEFPSLFTDPESLQPIAFEEYRLRRQAGERPDPLDYARRYGVRVDDWPGSDHSFRLEEVARSFQAFRLAGGLPSNTWQPPAKASPMLEGLFRERVVERADDLARGLTLLPEAGTEFSGFFLLAELGRGAFGRVYLARQHHLADRPVALKVSADGRAEAETLARLQHTHIVPIHSVHTHGPLQAVCMPYRGPVTLAHVVRQVQASGPPADARPYRDALEQANRHDAAPRPHAFGEVVPKRSHVETTLWVGACLAQALHHAHSRGVLHRDLKPSNVLLADDGTPLLLDFNVARDERAGPCEAAIGGTLPYMAPEQLESFETGEDRLDGRSDVYSLGIVLFELLTGRFPFSPVRADDDPAALAGRLLEERRRPPPSPRAFNRGIGPSAASIVRHCLEPDPARRYPSADALREDIERHLSDRPLRYAPEPSARERWGKWWRRSPRLRSGLAVGAVSLTLLLAIAGWWTARVFQEADRTRRMTEDFSRHLHHALFLLATRPETEHQRREGVQEAEAALALVAPLGVAGAKFGRAAAELRRLKGDAADEPAPDGLLERSRALVKSARYRDALPLLAEHLRDAPDDYWALFLQGLAWEGMRRDDRALPAYTACIALDPKFHGVYVNRGLLHMRRGRFAEAEADLTRALKMYPRRVETHLDRALTRIGSEDYRGAEADLTAALDGGVAPTRVYFLRARVRRAVKDEKGAKADIEEGLRLTPKDELGWIARGVVKRGRDATGAMADFDEALKINPTSRAALMGKANVYAEYLRDQKKAREVLEQVLKLYPDHPPALAGQAVVLARLGQRDDALEHIAAALDRDPCGEIRYQAACVHALLGNQDAGMKELKAAIGERYGLAFVDKDDDLKGLRKHEGFAELVRAARALRGG